MIILIEKKIIFIFIFTCYFNCAFGQVINKSNAQRLLERELNKRTAHSDRNMHQGKHPKWCKRYPKCQYLNIELLKKCIEFGANPNTSGKDTKWTCLHECAMQNDMGFANQLLADGVFVCATNWNNATPFTIAAQPAGKGACSYNKEMVNFLVTHISDKDCYKLRTKSRHLTATEYLCPDDRKLVNDLINEFDTTASSESIQFEKGSLEYVKEKIKDFAIANLQSYDDRFRCIFFNCNEDEFCGTLGNEYSEKIKETYPMIIDSIPINLTIPMLACIYGRSEIINLWREKYYHVYRDTTLIKRFLKNNRVFGYNAYSFDADSILTKRKLKRIADQNASPDIVWIFPKDSQVDTNDIYIKACIKNVSNINDIQLHVQSKKIDTRSHRVSGKKFTCCDGVLFEKWIHLDDTLNSISILARNRNNKVISNKKITFRRSPKFPPDTQVKYHAILIAEEKYEDTLEYPTLMWPVKNADSLKKVLCERYGFDVNNITLLYNKNRYSIDSGVKEILQKMTAFDYLLIFYAGHGEKIEFSTINGFCFLPIDVKSNDATTYLQYYDILKYIRDCNAKQILLLVDACNAGYMIDDILDERNIMPNNTVFALPSSPSQAMAYRGGGGGIDKNLIKKDLAKIENISPNDIIQKDRKESLFKRGRVLMTSAYKESTVDSSIYLSNLITLLKENTSEYLSTLDIQIRNQYNIEYTHQPIPRLGDVCRCFVFTLKEMKR